MTTEDVLTTHRNIFLAALLNRDFDVLSMLYSNDYMLVRPDGTVLNKNEILRDLRESDLIFKSIEISGEEVRVYGDIGILTGESRTVAERRGVSSSAHFRFIAVYAWTGNALNLIHFQSTSSAEKALC